ncbi:hypothetical protein ACGF1Z_29780 [Streptomyces sp. NPDC048018]|uniref:hypothetical protein n=1 Tax=Streptomyces sp. NPDC048018 TaxID=3365499 RepID=UPI003720327C
MGEALALVPVVDTDPEVNGGVQVEPEPVPEVLPGPLGPLAGVVTSESERAPVRVRSEGGSVGHGHQLGASSSHHGPGAGRVE